MNKFEVTEEQVREWAKIEAEAGCDISAGSHHKLTQLLEGKRLYKEAIAKHPNNPSSFVHWLHSAGESAEGDALKAFLEFTGEWKDA